MYQKLILLLCLILVQQSSSTRSRAGRQLDLDAIIEGRLSNHVIGERQSRMLSSETDRNVTASESSNVSNSTNDQSSDQADIESSFKTGKLLDEEETLHKHSSFVSHYASEEELSKSEELKKSIESLEQLLGTSARVVNNGDPFPQASSIVPISYLNPVYPSEDKILAALINQAATNIVNSQQNGDLSAAHSNPSPIYSSSADKQVTNNQGNPSSSSSGGLSSFLNIGGSSSNNNGNNNKKKPFASISSSIQEFAASMFPNRITNKFIKRKQSGQSTPSSNQLEYANFASECKCVPYYMCKNGYIVQNDQKPNQMAPSASAAPSGFVEQNKPYEPSVADLIESSSNSASQPFSTRYYDPQRLGGLLVNPEDLQSFQKQQEMLMAASFIQQNGYPATSSAGVSSSSSQLQSQSQQQQKDAKQEKPQPMPTPLPLTIDRRTQLTDDSSNVQKSQENKNTELELPIDERSIDGSKTEFNNQTEGVLENAEIEALTRMFNNYQFPAQSAPQIFAGPSMISEFTPQQQNCGILRTCCPVLNQKDVLIAQQSISFMQAQQVAASQQAPSTPMFAFENFQPTFIDPAMIPPFNRPPQMGPSSSHAQPSQNNFIYQPVYQPDASANGLPQMSQMNPQQMSGSPLSSKRPAPSHQFSSMPSHSSNQMQNINNQMVSNQMVSNQMGNPMISSNQMINNAMNNAMNSQMSSMNNPMNNPMNNQMSSSMSNPINNPINNQMMNGQMGQPQFTPFNKWLQNDKKVYQPNFAQPSLSSYLLTKPNFQARNPSTDFYVDSGSDESRFSSSKSYRNVTDQQCGRRAKLQYAPSLENYPQGTAKFGDYPWMAELLKKVDDGKSMFVCGATLISDQWVLTAAHCTKNAQAKDFKIRLGEYDVYREDEPYPFVERNVEEIIRHAQYNPSTLHNDIALLRLDSPINFAVNPHIQPVCKASFGENYVKRKCFLSGYGKSEFRGSYQSVLREVELPILDHSQCAQQLQQTRLGSSFVLDRGFMCAGGSPGLDACTGDAGSALVCEEIVGGDSTWKAVGLVSWGIGCGQAIPGVYTNLGFYESWIDSTIAAHDNSFLANPGAKDHQFRDHNTLNAPTTDDLMSESSSLYESIIKKSQAHEKKPGNLLSIINERTNEKGELSIS